MQARNVFLGFIDVIGAREFSGSTAHLYLDRIIEFQKALYEKQLFLSDGGNEAGVYVYSDCAFLYSRSADALIDYLTQVRKYAYARGNGFDKEPLFFKAAIVKGDFELKDVGLLNCRSNQGGGKSVAIQNSIVSGISFSWNAVQVYLAHEHSKAIGICVSQNALAQSILPRLIHNVHFPSERSGGPHTFTDVRFVEQELVDSVLDDILRAFFKARVKSRKFEKYYVPILCNWVQSLDLGKVLATHPSEFNDLEQGCGRILYLVGSGYFERTFGSVVGLNYFYLTVLCHLYRTYFITRDPEKGTESIRDGAQLPAPIDALEAYLLRLRKVQTAIPAMPQDCMSPLTKELLLNRLARPHAKAPLQSKSAI
jgi:hypothetical protein